jgi:ACS family tartrate transporter-like MFS transporter
LTREEAKALGEELERSKRSIQRMTLVQALAHPAVLLLAISYFFTTTANYAFEFFVPSILEKWYSLKLDAITWLVIVPPLLALVGQLLVGWNSDRTGERRMHTVVPILIGAACLGIAPLTHGHLMLSLACLTLGFAGIKSLQPAFWSLPSLVLSESAAAGSTALINSVGNAGGFVGPSLLGYIEKHTGSFAPGLYFLCASMLVSATIVTMLGIGKRAKGVIPSGTPRGISGAK